MPGALTWQVPWQVLKCPFVERRGGVGLEIDLGGSEARRVSGVAQELSADNRKRSRPRRTDMSDGMAVPEITGGAEGKKGLNPF